jgi:predicted aspartyl protease
MKIRVTPVAFVIFALLACCAFSQEPFQIKFKTVGNGMIVVPVRINGAGPYDFLVDTGSTDAVVDQKLAEQLNLPRTGRVTFTTPQRKANTFRVYADSLSIAGATVRGLRVCAINHYADLLPNVRGTLGEDFLRYFDLLIDNQHHVITFELGHGALSDTLDGERLPLSPDGSGDSTRNRLVVAGTLNGRDMMRLQLDSGSSKVMLFTKVNAFHLISDEQTSRSIGGILGGSFDADTQVGSLRLGQRNFPNLTIIVPSNSVLQMGVDGFVPTLLFRSIFISHSGRFVILDPLSKPKLDIPASRSTDIAIAQSLRQNVQR